MLFKANCRRADRKRANLMVQLPQSLELTISDETVRQVEQAVRSIAPDDCDLIGGTYLNALARGVDFRTLQYGRQLSLVDSIALIASLATLAHISIALGKWWLTSHGSTVPPPTAADLEPTIRELATRHKQAERLLKINQDQLIALIDELRSNSSK